MLFITYVVILRRMLRYEHLSRLQYPIAQPRKWPGARRASILVAGANEKLLFTTSACRPKLFVLSAAMAVTAVAEFWPLWIHHSSHL